MFAEVSKKATRAHTHTHTTMYKNPWRTLMGNKQVSSVFITEISAKHTTQGVQPDP